MYMATRGDQQQFASFREMVYCRYGRSISELFLIPYNEKLYSVSADRLDPDAMGDFSRTLISLTCWSGSNLYSKEAIDTLVSYNAHFCYHRDGARA